MKMGDPPVRNRRPAKKLLTTGGNTPPTRIPAKKMITGGNTPPVKTGKALRTGGNLPPSVKTGKVLRTGGNLPPSNTGIVPPHMRKSSRALDRLSRAKTPRKGR